MPYRKVETRAIRGRQKREPKQLSRYQSRLSLFLGVTVVAGIAYGLQAKFISDLKPFVHNGNNNIPEVFEMVDIPGRGKGLRAAQNIKQGDQIIKELPLFVVPSSINESPITFIYQQLNTLNLVDRERFFNLSYVNLPKNAAQLGPKEYEQEVALAIFQTNAVAIDSNRVGIFPYMARLNHGCSSAFNVVYSWREREGAIVVHALRDVDIGDELLTTYINTRRPRSERREHLLRQYDFLCSCSVCSLPETHSETSDRRLVDISANYHRFASWGKGEIDGAAAIEAVRNIWKVEDEEVYWSERGQLAADAAFVAAAHSDAGATKEWARLAVEWYGYELGQDTDLVREMRAVMRDTRRHRAWGTRQPQFVGTITSRVAPRLHDHLSTK